MDDDAKLPAVSSKRMVDMAYLTADDVSCGSGIDHGWAGYQQELHGQQALVEGADQDEGLLRVVVKRTGRAEIPCLELTIERSATVKDLKTLIQDELADESPCLMVPVERQRLIFQGRMLTDDSLSLTDDIKMKPDQDNYVHLAPLPKGVTPSPRKPLENKASTSPQRPQGRQHRLRANRRSARSFHPYRVSSTPYARQSPPGSRPVPSFMRGSFHDSTTSLPLPCETQQPVLPLRVNLAEDELRRQALSGMIPHQSTPVLGLHEMLGLGRARTLRADAEQSIFQDANVVIPLCSILPVNLNLIIADLQSDRVARNVDETVAILDQVSQQTASLSNSLRTLAAQQTSLNALPLALSGLGLPLGNI